MVSWALIAFFAAFLWLLAAYLEIPRSSWHGYVSLEAQGLSSSHHERCSAGMCQRDVQVKLGGWTCLGSPETGNQVPSRLCNVARSSYLSWIPGKLLRVANISSEGIVCIVEILCAACLKLLEGTQHTRKFRVHGSQHVIPLGPGGDGCHELINRTRFSAVNSNASFSSFLRYG